MLLHMGISALTESSFGILLAIIYLNCSPTLKLLIGKIDLFEIGCSSFALSGHSIIIIYSVRIYSNRAFDLVGYVFTSRGR